MKYWNGETAAKLWVGVQDDLSLHPLTKKLLAFHIVLNNENAPKDKNNFHIIHLPPNSECFVVSTKSDMMTACIYEEKSHLLSSL